MFRFLPTTTALAEAPKTASKVEPQAEADPFAGDKTFIISSVEHAANTKAKTVKPVKK